MYGVSEEYIWLIVSHTNPHRVTELINMLLWHHKHMVAELPSLRGKRASLVAHTVKNLPAMHEIQLWSLGQEDPLEKGMATHSSILAWRIPWRKDNPLQYSCLENSMEKGAWRATVHGAVKQKTGHDWVTNTHFRSKDVFTCFCHRNCYYKNRCKRGFSSSQKSYCTHLFLQLRSLCNKHKNRENHCCFGQIITTTIIISPAIRVTTKTV